MVQVGKCHAKDTESCASAVHGREADARRALGTERESGRVQEEPGTGGYSVSEDIAEEFKKNMAQVGSMKQLYIQG